ncbi:MAG TPA: hypothetical protein VG265_10270 [Gaiellaceae bacterium]|nr:hypothetical protein [Gaiellaceae bacterium]
MRERREGERDAAIRYVMLGQAFFLATMLVCCAIRPSRAAVKAGLSYYGNDVMTAIPFVGGFVLCIGLTAAGIRRLGSLGPAVSRLRSGVSVILLLMLPVPLTPYRVDVIFDWLHLGAVSILFLVGLAFGGWLALHLLRDTLSLLVFALLTVAAVSIVTAQAGVDDYMIPSELLFQLLLVWLVVRSIRLIANRSPDGFRSQRLIPQLVPVAEQCVACTDGGLPRRVRTSGLLRDGTMGDAAPACGRSASAAGDAQERAGFVRPVTNLGRSSSMRSV